MTIFFNISKFILLIIGIGMLVLSLLLYANTKTFLNDAVVTDGIVVELKRNTKDGSDIYHPVVEYTPADGTRIALSSPKGQSKPAFSVGDKVRVQYLPQSPETAKIMGYAMPWLSTIISTVIGGAFFLMGGGLILKGVLSNSKEKYLRVHGVQIQTDFQSVFKNLNFRVNARHPYRVRCQWQDPKTSKVHIFESENIWFNPEKYIKSDNITVFIDRNNPKKYFVDLSFLPDMAK